jgi:hypothetical protein
MQFPKGSGLEALDKVVRRSLKYYSGLINNIEQQQKAARPINQSAPSVLPSLDMLTRPVENLLKNLNSAVSQITSKPAPVDYSAMVGSFLPPGAKLLRPQYPENSNEIQFEDFDGDGKNELVASYRTNEGVKTLILRKDAVQWSKMAEISNPEFDSIHYRNSADVAGDGKQYLLLGLRSKSRGSSLFAYSLTDGSAKRIFSRNYDKLDLLKPRTAGAKASIALWNEEAPDIYDIELVGWNGLELEKLDHTRYLSRRVVPYYVKKLRQNPDDAVSWYNLANSFIKTGNTENASTAINLGLERSTDTQMRERFTLLKSRI